MRILAFDTATRATTVALLDTDGGVIVQPAAAKARLKEMIAALLEGVTKEPFEAVLKGIAAPQKLWRLRPKAVATPAGAATATPKPAAAPAATAKSSAHPE